MMGNELIPALLSEVFFLKVVGLLFLGLSSIVSKIYRKKRPFLKELVILLLFYFTLNVILMLGLI
ncbi:hypothetical protein J2799_001660 [Chryseobacterium vietnamense]|nr:hypothetical protein [Chryseobacterium vietnamense]